MDIFDRLDCAELSAQLTPDELTHLAARKSLDKPATTEDMQAARQALSYFLQRPHLLPLVTETREVPTGWERRYTNDEWHLYPEKPGDFVHWQPSSRGPQHRHEEHLFRQSTHAETVERVDVHAFAHLLRKLPEDTQSLQGRFVQDWLALHGEALTPAEAATPAPAQAPAQAPTQSSVPDDTRAMKRDIISLCKARYGATDAVLDPIFDDAGRSGIASCKTWEKQGEYWQEMTIQWLAERGHLPGYRYSDPRESKSSPLKLASVK